MPTVNSISEAMAYIEKAVRDSLAYDVFEEVRGEEARQINRVVYDGYKPKFYKRRWDMHNSENIVGTVHGLTLEVENITPLNTYFDPTISKGVEPSMTGDLAQIVETGDGYDYYSPGARPFTQATIEALSENQNHVEGLKRGLRKAGIKVR